MDRCGRTHGMSCGMARPTSGCDRARDILYTSYPGIPACESRFLHRAYDCGEGIFYKYSCKCIASWNRNIVLTTLKDAV